MSLIMGYSFDFFYSSLKCHYCNYLATADEYENMQTYLRDEPQLEDLGVGSFVGNQFHDMEGKHYSIVNPIKSDQKILMDMWYCPNCGKANWANIVIDKEDVISEIYSVEVSLESIKSSNYISFNITDKITNPEEILKNWSMK
jgi:hypothetical protein